LVLLLCYFLYELKNEKVFVFVDLVSTIFTFFTT